LRLSYAAGAAEDFRRRHRTTYVESLSPAEYLDIRASRSFAHTESFDLGNRHLSGGDVPERVFTALLLDDLFPVLGVTPALGRGFTRDELGPNGPPAAIFTPVRQQTAWNQLFMLIRTDGSPAALMPAARQAISSLDAEQPAYLIQTLEDATAASTFQQRIAALLVSIFAGVAVLLAAIGIYGVAVSARTQEWACAWPSVRSAATCCGWSSDRCCACRRSG